MKMESSVIVGERRIGKTSLAYYAYNYFLENHTDKYEPVWIDCQSSFARTVDGFFSQIKQYSSIAYVSGKTQEECLKNFETAVRKAPKKILLFIDEFEIITNIAYQEEFTESFYMQLRGLAAQGKKFALLPTAQYPLPHICKHVLGVSSPFYTTFSTYSLNVFSKSDV